MRSCCLNCFLKVRWPILLRPRSCNKSKFVPLKSQNKLNFLSYHLLWSKQCKHDKSQTLHSQNRWKITYWGYSLCVSSMLVTFIIQMFTSLLNLRVRSCQPRLPINPKGWTAHCTPPYRVTLLGTHTVIQGGIPQVNIWGTQSGPWLLRLFR